MPTYEYECTDCNRHFEFFQKISEPAKDICPVCNGSLKRLISTGAGIIFKGSGFYVTDYKRKETKPKDSSSKEPNCCQVDKKEKKD